MMSKFIVFHPNCSDSEIINAKKEAIKTALIMAYEGEQVVFEFTHEDGSALILPRNFLKECAFKEVKE